ncbi:DUF2950 domain-containing protein [Rhodovastum atsumiense]|uniref:DUF2950 domain-containing protein n=1 Tax=Rhodovastum atsumiense TaxID=504468 RepID=A0A5M6IQ69_9PROT|nr:DUF2950 domain-containing protein [Rhodovastum atsumiense]
MARAAPQPGFAAPEDAVGALVAALQGHDPAALGALLGPGSETLVRSGDAVRDREEARRFLDAYAERHALVAAGEDRLLLQVGPQGWPLPIPLVRRDGQWRFDATAGAQEIVNRRIGRNEIAAIRFCLAYVDAQAAYHRLFQEVTGTGAYAQRLVSSPGNYDGLYWPSDDNVPESPLAPVVAEAMAQGYPGPERPGPQMVYEGYQYRILTAQGPNAPGGARSYLKDGKLVDGFALVAWPAVYGASGIMTFQVDQDGVVFQKDLGPDTATRAQAIRRFDPGLDWARVDILEK